MSYVLDTLRIFHKTLDEKNPNALDRFMKTNESYGKDIAKDFHKTQLNEILDNQGLTDIVIKILQNLGIPSYEWGRYVGAPMSVYQFLLEMNELTQKKHAHLLKLIDHIDTQMGNLWYSLFLISIVSLLALTLLFPLFIQSEIITLISQIFTAVLFIPALRIIYNAGCALYSFYASIVDTHIRLSDRLRNNIFEISGAAIKIAASCLVFVVVATSPIVSILIITATALSVLKEAVGFIQLLVERRKKYLEESNDPLMREQHLARLDNTFRKTRNDLIMNIVAAVLLTAIVAVWTFVPGGIPLIASAITAMAVIYITKMVFRFFNEKNKKKELLETFETLETTKREKEVGCNESVEPKENMTYAKIHVKLGEPHESLSRSEPLSPEHYDPFFQACAGNEREEKLNEPSIAVSAL